MKAPLLPLSEWANICDKFTPRVYTHRQDPLRPLGWGDPVATGTLHFILAIAGTLHFGQSASHP